MIRPAGVSHIRGFRVAEGTNWVSSAPRCIVRSAKASPSSVVSHLGTVLPLMSVVPPLAIFFATSSRSNPSCAAMRLDFSSWLPRSITFPLTFKPAALNAISRDFSNAAVPATYLLVVSICLKPVHFRVLFAPRWNMFATRCCGQETALFRGQGSSCPRSARWRQLRAQGWLGQPLSSTCTSEGSPWP